jgi:GNAT superfamily N-acetyltransferase
MVLEFRSHYFDDSRAKASFERCAKAVFGLDFSLWQAKGLWDDRYRPFSAFKDDECIASICVYPSLMSVAGEKKTGAQLLTVGTLPEFRGQGIQRKIWERARDWIEQECDFVFLFTDEPEAGFYERLGLRRRAEHTEIVPCPECSGETEFSKLDLDADYAVVERLAGEREMVSDRLGFLNPNLLLFMFLYVYRDWTYHLRDLDAVVVAEEAADRVRIHDVVARKMPRLSDIEGFLATFGKDVDFLFCTDRLGVEGATYRRVDDGVLIVSDEFDLTGNFVFPYSIRA